MSNKIMDHVSDSANVLLSGVANVATSFSQSVEEVVSSVSTGVEDAVYNMSAGVRRLITDPPSEDEIHDDINIQYDSALPTPCDSNEDRVQVFGELSLTSRTPDVLLLETSSLSFENDLGISENYFSEPEIFDLGSEASIEDVEAAIKIAKDFILNCQESSQQRRGLVQRLIQLRLALERAKEEKEVAIEGVQVKQGHQLTPVLSQLKPSSKQFCDKCTRIIWNVLHVTYQCCLCDYQCHGKCVKCKHPKCPSLKFEEKSTFVLKICPESGLSAQDFRCTQCRALINGRNVWGEPRLCDYSGQYFCPACHWNARMSTPARIIHNWDFETRLVSQQAKHFLTYIHTKPLIALENLNPHLFKFVEEFHIVKQLREELIQMKTYLRTCRVAQDSRLLRRLEVRQHFVDNAHFYSLKDLVDLNEGTLTSFLQEVHQEFASHIKDKCEACQGKGFICELCDSEEVIFPFDAHVSVCKMCQASFHETCFASVSVCPRCIRQSSRRLKTQRDKEESVIR